MDTNQSAISWAAIIAGAVAIAALTLVLVTLGSAVGFSSVSPWPNSGITATTFQISTGLYFVFTALVASTIGGYIAGRLRAKWTDLHTYEVQFRDTAHGFLAWAIAAVVGAAALGTATSYLAGAVAKAPDTDTNYYVAELMRPGSAQPAAAANAVPGANPTPAATAAPGAAIATREARSILAHAAAQADTVSDSDRAYLAQLVATQTGASQSDAEKRVTDVLNQAKAEADQARKAAASISIWLTISMFVGAFAAALAAIEGGQLRDRKWRGVLWTRGYTQAQIEP
jgi:hypothetical protein